MAEIWGAAIMVGGSIISGMAASKKAKADQKFASKEARAADERDSMEARLSDERQAKYQAILGQFNKDSDYYYSQKTRENKQRGLAQFRQFSTVNQFAPKFVGGDNQIVVPEKPDAVAAVKQFDLDQAKPAVEPEATAEPAAKKKKKSFLDPLGLF